MTTKTDRRRRERSFLKWVGGKYKSVDQLISLFPKKFETYYEPFVGSGVVFFNLCPERAILSDVEFRVISTFRCVQSFAPFVCGRLSALINSPEIYYQIREKFNLIDDEFKWEDAADFIYLNKCGYNGLYRVNSNGAFNVPYGKSPGQPHRKYDIIIECSRKLEGTTLLHLPYQDAIASCKAGDFIYFDPPYYPEKGDSFIGYNSQKFTQAQHHGLLKVCEELNSRGVLFALSNSDCSYIKELYSDFNLHQISTTRSVSCSKNRGHYSELLVCNY